MNLAEELERKYGFNQHATAKPIPAVEGGLPNPRGIRCTKVEAPDEKFRAAVDEAIETCARVVEFYKNHTPEETAAGIRALKQ
jgi:hypothetical protein